MKRKITLEEKVGQMTQYDWGSIDVNPDIGLEHRQSMHEQLERGLIGSIFNISGVEEANGLQLPMKEKSRLGNYRTIVLIIHSAQVIQPRFRVVRQ